MSGSFILQDRQTVLEEYLAGNSNPIYPDFLLTDEDLVNWNTIYKNREESKFFKLVLQEGSHPSYNSPRPNKWMLLPFYFTHYPNRSDKPIPKWCIPGLGLKLLVQPPKGQFQLWRTKKEEETDENTYGKASEDTNNLYKDEAWLTKMTGLAKKAVDEHMKNLAESQTK